MSEEEEWKEVVPEEDEEGMEDEEEVEVEMEGKGRLEMKVKGEVWIQRVVDDCVWEREAVRSRASIAVPLKVLPEVALKTGALSWMGRVAPRSLDSGMFLLPAVVLVEIRSNSQIYACRPSRGCRLPLAICCRYSSCFPRRRHRCHPLFLCIFSPPLL